MTKRKIIIGAVIVALVMIIHFTTPYKLLSLNWWKSLAGVDLIPLYNELPQGNCQYAKRSLEDITDINWHHTAGPVTQDPYMLANYHIQGNQWCGIGYHILVYPDRAYITQPLDTISYHNGFNNSVAVGVSLVGDFSNQPPPKEQYDRAINITRYLLRKLPNAKFVVGHGEVKGTSCPGKTIDMNEVRRLTGGKARA